MGDCPGRVLRGCVFCRLTADSGFSELRGGLIATSLLGAASTLASVSVTIQVLNVFGILGREYIASHAHAIGVETCCNGRMMITQC